MPVFFLNDTGLKYRSTYFGKFPHIWVHGDLCMITTDPPGIAMLGRSDATLNPNGVRFGSADIYHIVETFPEVADSVCVGQVNKAGDERVVLFLKLADGVASLSEDLVQRMKRSIREELSPRHVPAVVMAVPDIPYTINGKKVELAIKRIISYNPVMAAEENLSSLANPGSLQFFRGSTDLKLWAINEK
ncbi:unnamed protein product [Notodromas monacha]|uniref:AMP-binding enzyme C-terminal domain-containing protein n=1 Tax=Notodromas monacha TaxID=399045 RepID=A0A7R9GHF8_9CRUS|nr:unnamed protein product [Notodromas monacha]CAG0922837.1 unnamed protein product [Notodromas monacha]